METPVNPIFSFLPLVAIIGIFYLIFRIIKGRKISQISCPKCGNLCNQGGYKNWQILVAVFGFPWGLLALLADKNPTECYNCGFIWQA